MADYDHVAHPDITEEMWNDIDGIIKKYRNKPGSLITVLRECQDRVGYLPIELIDYIGLGMAIAQSTVFGVASFYSLFSMEPKGRNTVKVCMGTACYVKGIKEIVSRVQNKYGLKEGQTTSDRRFSMESVRCLGACGLAPVMVINQDIHGNMKPDKVIKIMDEYK